MYTFSFEGLANYEEYLSNLDTSLIQYVDDYIRTNNLTFVSDYADMCIWWDGQINGKGLVLYSEENNFKLVKAVKVFSRSECLTRNVLDYDDADFLTLDKTVYVIPSYDLSAEFITDTDCYYVYFDYID